MSEESQVDENIVEDENEIDESGTQVELSQEDLLKEVAKLRKEAASRRVKNKDLDSKLKEYDDWKRSQMSEVERERAEKAELLNTVRVLREESWRRDAASKAGLDPDFADRLNGETEDELIADAKRLAAKLGKTGTRSSQDALAGKRGRPVGGAGTITEDEWFRSEFLK